MWWNTHIKVLHHKYKDSEIKVNLNCHNFEDFYVCNFKILKLKLIITKLKLLQYLWISM